MHIFQGLSTEITCRVASMFKGNEEHAEETGVARRQAEINIFTVASGLLYEVFHLLFGGIVRR